MILTKKTKKTCLYLLCDDLLKEIARYLDNQSIIELLVTSYHINKKLKCKEISYDKNGYLNIYKHLFTSITIKPHHNLTDYIQHYINHKQSIKIQNVHHQIKNVWPFLIEHKPDNKNDKNETKRKKIKKK